MGWYWPRRKTTFLFALTLFGLVYSGWVQFFGVLTGMDQVDGIIGVVFGLYICCHPAAFIVDLLFFRRGTFADFSSDRLLVLWLIFNLLVLLVGWLVIFTGTTRLLGRAEAITLYELDFYSNDLPLIYRGNLFVTTSEPLDNQRPKTS